MVTTPTPDQTGQEPTRSPGDLTHGHAFCAPCRAVLCDRSDADVVAHLRSHHEPADVAQDFQRWERELTGTSPDTDRNQP